MLYKLLFAMLPLGLALEAGDVCEDTHSVGNGICKAIKDCATNEWTYGTMENPICDVKGSDYRNQDTKVCCLPKPGAIDLLPGVPTPEEPEVQEEVQEEAETPAGSPEEVQEEVQENEV